MQPPDYEVIIIGGSSAGLSAALVLGRSRRRVRVYDHGKPCNRVSHASHGFLTRDGVAPADLLRIAREQLAPYPNVELHHTAVVAASPQADGFRVETADGETATARKLILATGVRDVLPSLPNIEQFWGSSVFHCPYCDGWEVRDQPFLIYGEDDGVFHHVHLLLQWSSSLTVCTGGALTIDADERAFLARHHIRLIETPIVRLEGSGGQLERVVFADGSALEQRVLFIRPQRQQHYPLVDMLGCALDDNGIVQIDAHGQTSVAGVYAAGDLSNGRRSVAAAVAQGSAAGMGVNYALIMEDFA
jgi:thioredoxin reductase